MVHFSVRYVGLLEGTILPTETDLEHRYFTQFSPGIRPGMFTKNMEFQPGKIAISISFNICDTTFFLVGTFPTLHGCILLRNGATLQIVWFYPHVPHETCYRWYPMA